MNNNFNTLKKKFINEIILPGTHNSGTYKINLNKKLEREYEIIRLLGKFFNPLKYHIQKFTLNQELTIYEQCKIGIRMLDLRIFYDKKNNLFYNSHSFITVSLEDIVNDLIKFIKENNNEYIIVCYKQDYSYKNQKYDYRVLDEYINSKKYCTIGYKNLYTSTYEQLLTTKHRIIWVSHSNVKQQWGNTFNKKNLIEIINNYNNSKYILYERKFLKKYVYEKDHKIIMENFENKIPDNFPSALFYGISCCLTPQFSNVAFEIIIHIITSTITLVFIIYNVISYIKYNKQKLKFNKFKINNKSVYSLIIPSVVIFLILLSIKTSKITNLKEQTKEFHKSFLKIKLNKNLGFYLFDYPTKELTTKIIDINLK
tara:strand:- start:1070 stop:2179 length:1110 start_codon:yes stop_codon:yes gene_type:complete